MARQAQYKVSCFFFFEAGFSGVRVFKLKKKKIVGYIRMEPKVHTFRDPEVYKHDSWCMYIVKYFGGRGGSTCDATMIHNRCCHSLSGNEVDIGHVRKSVRKEQEGARRSKSKKKRKKG